jgi:membrane fusion protein, multidrug efflux system
MKTKTTIRLKQQPLLINSKSNIMKTILSLSFIALLLLGCGNTTTETAPPPPATLPVLSIHPSVATTEAEFPAAIQGTVDVEIRPQVSGTLDQIFVDEGAYVAKGQPLFKINDHPYREQLNSALGSLNAAKAAAVNAQLEVEKLSPLVQNKVISEYQLKSAKASLSIAKANVEQSKAMVGTAQINLGYTLIKAPVSGYIGRLPKKQGSQITQADPEALTKLSDIKEVYAYFSLGENDFINFKSQYQGHTIQDKLKKIPPVSLVLSDNSVYTESGRVDMVDGQFDKTTGAITLRATFPNSKGLLRSGNTGKVRLSMQHRNSLLVPQGATMEIQDKVFVFLVDKKNAVTKQPVTVGGKSGTDYLITEGIKSGDRIVAKGFESLPDGAVIIPEKEKKAVAKI